MKRFYLIVCLIILTISFTGCLTTLYPFFTEKDVVFKPELIENWIYTRETKKGSIFKGSILFETINHTRTTELYPGIRQIADKGYLVTWKDSNGKSTSQEFVFLAKIGKYFYLDFYPAEMENQQEIDKVFKEQFTKLHSCYRIDISNLNSFTLKRFDGDFVNELIDKKQIRMSYEKNGRRVITASTQELQEYLVKFSDNPKAYEEAYSCTRTINY